MDIIGGAAGSPCNDPPPPTPKCFITSDYIYCSRPQKCSQERALEPRIPRENLLWSGHVLHRTYVRTLMCYCGKRSWVTKQCHGSKTLYIQTKDSSPQDDQPSLAWHQFQTCLKVSLLCVEKSLTRPFGAKSWQACWFKEEGTGKPDACPDQDNRFRGIDREVEI